MTQVSRSLLERFANLSNRYDSSLEDKKSVISKSVFRVIESFLRTTKGSVLSNVSYGMIDLFRVVNMFNNPSEHQSLFNYIKTNLEQLDKRISTIKVSEGINTSKDGIVPYISIEVYLRNELFHDLAPNEIVKFSLGYDMLGNIYQIKER